MTQGKIASEAGTMASQLLQRNGISVSTGGAPKDVLFCQDRAQSFLPGGHTITKHTGGLAQRSESKNPKYLSKIAILKKNAKIIPPK